MSVQMRVIKHVVFMMVVSCGGRRGPRGGDFGVWCRRRRPGGSDGGRGAEAGEIKAGNRRSDSVVERRRGRKGSSRREVLGKEVALMSGGSTASTKSTVVTRCVADVW